MLYVKIIYLKTIYLKKPTKKNIEKLSKKATKQPPTLCEKVSQTSPKII